MPSPHARQLLHRVAYTPPRQPRGLGSAASSILVGAAIGGAVSAVEFGASQWIASARLRGGQKIAATEILERTQYWMQRNYDAYNAGGHTQTEQATALHTFDSLWDNLMSPQGCGNIDLGSAGQRCISERKPGGVYDIFKALRDPIANDANVQPDPIVDTPTAATTAAITQAAAVLSHAADAAVSNPASLTGSPLVLLAVAAVAVVVILQ